jgi:extracellular factor (EF) 3-hydroxypalmitic acid methyl ester biosynthesis protein
VAELTVHNEITFVNSEGIKCVGQVTALSRHHVTLELYHPEAIVQLSEVLNDLAIKRSGRTVYKGRAVVTSMIDTAMTLLVSASLVDEWQDLTDIVDAPELIGEEASRFVADWEEERNVDPAFQLVLNELRSFCFELSRWLSHVDSMVGQDFANQQLELDILDSLSEKLLPVFKEKFSRFESSSKTIIQGDKKEVLRHQHLAQRELHPLILRAPWVHRTYSKPLGFAGDYEMVNMMLRNPYEGPSIYAKIINRLFQSGGPAYAHRNRLQILLEQLQALIKNRMGDGGLVRILNIGCGPAIEIQNLIRSNPDLANQCEFVLMDFSDDALSYTQKTINNLLAETGCTAKFQFIHERVQTLLRRAAKARLQADMQADSYDLCYCAGLFDYLSDSVCKNLLRFMLQLCKPNASIIATNVHPDHGVMAVMEFLLEWHLIYRDKRDMESLMPHGKNSRVFSDSTGINVFLQTSRI